LAGDRNASAEIDQCAGSKDPSGCLLLLEACGEREKNTPLHSELNLKVIIFKALLFIVLAYILLV